MRVLFQAYGLDKGGGIEHIHQLLNALIGKFNDTYIVICSRGSPLETLRKFSNCDVRTYDNRTFKELTRLYLNCYYVGRIVDENRVDLVWNINIGQYFKLRAPQVISVNNSFQVCPGELISYHPNNRLHVSVLRWFFGRSLKMAEGVIVQTDRMRELVCDTGNAPSLVAVIPKAVESECDEDCEQLPLNMQEILSNNRSKNVFTFIYVSTYGRHKNHKTLVDAFFILARKGINTRVVFTISDNELEHISNEKGDYLKRNGYIVPVGWISKKQLKALYNKCDACVMPSLMESMSSAHLEAMHWRKPQIVSDLPFARDLCGEAGLYAEAENPEDWALKIEQLISDGGLRSKLVEEGTERMKAYPSTWTEVAGKARDFLDKVLEGRQLRSKPRSHAGRSEEELGR